MHCESQEADFSNGRAGDYHGAEDVLYAHGAIVECPARLEPESPKRRHTPGAQ